MELGGAWLTLCVTRCVFVRQVPALPSPPERDGLKGASA
jgi:hypothetical protein